MTDYGTEGRILDALHDGSEATTGEIASRLDIRPGVAWKALSASLTSLRKRHLLRYEFDPAAGDREVRWRLSREGRAEARRRHAVRAATRDAGRIGIGRLSGSEDVSAR